MTTGGDVQLGLYEQLVTAGLLPDVERLGDAGLTADLAKLDDADGPRLLTRHVARVLEGLLEDLHPEDRIAVANAALNALTAHRLTMGAERVANLPKPVLRAVSLRAPGPMSVQVPRPEISLSASDLLVNGRGEPSLIRALTSEIASSNERIRIIVSFIRWTGVRLVLEVLEQARSRGVDVQVLTTTYMGASEKRAIDELVRIGAELKVSYDGRSSRLHAKGWLFERKTGFHTAYIGSSNLSGAAMVEGQEWNIRLSQAETPHLLDKFRATFEAYWADPVHGFEPYALGDPQIEDRLTRALQQSDTSRDTEPSEEDPLPFEITAYPFQQEILDDLERDRDVYARTRNLVVAATGTGKTVLAALDYRRLEGDPRWRQHEERMPRLLFVAHREEILRQSLRTFRQVLHMANFGDLMVGGGSPNDHRHLFASIQSLSRSSRLDAIPPDYYDVVIVDEFHHAEASTYTRLLDRLNPKLLLGLTATPERADGEDITRWFDGHISSELRLWDALERNLLVPFHYFGVGNEDLDFTRARWSGGSYNTSDLDEIVTGNDVITSWIVHEIKKYVADPTSMRALAFAVGKRHAHYLADRFARAGWKAIALDANTPRRRRQEAIDQLRDGSLQIIVAVDLFNEGVDIREIDTILMLRPTESATVFLQQLGRGLRRTADKHLLTVLDFIGFQGKQFRFDLRYRALTGVSRQQLVDAVEGGFPYLPAGTFVSLDRIAQRAVLDNVRQHVPSTAPQLVADVKAHAALRGLEEYFLGDYLSEAAAELADIYGRSHMSWSRACRQAGLWTPAAGPQEETLLRRVRALTHVDDLERLTAYRNFVTHPNLADSDDLSAPQRRLAGMLYFSLWPSGGHESYAAGFQVLSKHPAVVSELLQLWDVAEEHIPHATYAMSGSLSELPLRVHARYSREEMLAGVGWAHLSATSRRIPQGHTPGVRYVAQISADVFDMTWRKSDAQYSPTTMYRDYALSDRLIHWESQNSLREDSPTARRYIEHRQRGTNVLMFARESKHGPTGTHPYLFMGLAEYVSHSGQRPVSFTWRLERALPAAFFRSSQLLAG